MSEIDESCLAWLQVFMKYVPLRRRHHSLVLERGHHFRRGRGPLSVASLRPVTVSLQTTGQGLFVRIGFSGRDHFSQASITEPLTSCNIKLAVTQLVTFSIWMRHRSETPLRKCTLERCSVINEAILFGVDQCLAKTGSLISLEFFCSSKMPLVDYSVCMIHLKGIQNGTGTHLTNMSSAYQPNKDLCLTQDRLMKPPWYCARTVCGLFLFSTAIYTPHIS